MSTASLQPLTREVSVCDLFADFIIIFEQDDARNIVTTCYPCANEDELTARLKQYRKEFRLGIHRDFDDSNRSYVDVELGWLKGLQNFYIAAVACLEPDPQEGFKPQVYRSYKSAKKSARKMAQIFLVQNLSCFICVIPPHGLTEPRTEEVVML